jgi:dolichol-phosphate mannosyltransferase
MIDAQGNSQGRHETLATELTIVIPTFNERENIRPLIAAVDAALPSDNWEMIVVDDDSSDGTSSVVREIARHDPRIRCIQRIRRRGLSSACVEGMLASSSPYLAVMDADMQHDEKLLPEMLETLKTTDDDVVIGSRYTEGGSTGEFKGLRLAISRAATRLSQLLLGTQLSDPMSGFFMLRRSFLDRVVRKIYGRGFKILLDLFASSDQPVKYTELPYTMRTRQLGESKLGFRVTLEFFMMLLYKLSGRLVPGRFIKFSAVGLLGVGVHLAALYLVYLVLGQGFVFGQSIATLVAMTNNYILNNLFTFQDQKLTGVDFFIGLFKFYLACSLGALISVALGGFLHDQGTPWWLAGFTGAVAAAVWNFMTTSIFTWGSTSRKRTTQT